MADRYERIRDVPAMLPNDYSRCQGALMEAPEDASQLHPQCLHCLRRVDVLDGAVYSWMDAPLGLLAGEEELCERRKI